MKKIYYYNQRYPEYGIKQVEVKDELYLIGKDIKALEYIVVDYNIELDRKAEYIWISVYSPYEDEEIYVHDNNEGFNAHYIMSYNKEKLLEWWKDNFNNQKELLEERLEKFKVDDEVC